MIIDVRYNRTGSRWLELSMHDGGYTIRHESGAAYLGRVSEAEARARLEAAVELARLDGHRLVTLRGGKK